MHNLRLVWLFSLTYKHTFTRIVIVFVNAYMKHTLSQVIALTKFQRFLLYIYFNVNFLLRITINYVKKNSYKQICALIFLHCPNNYCTYCKYICVSVKDSKSSLLSLALHLSLAASRLWLPFQCVGSFGPELRAKEACDRTNRPETLK